jgi:uncharacterized protein (TIGR03083 family)
VEAWDLVDAERKDNLAMLEGLGPDQWDAQSLCGEWRVRDVAAHLTSPTRIGPGKFVGMLITSGFNFNKANAKDARDRGSADPTQLVEELRATIGSRKHPPGIKDVTVLTDQLIHGQDIRRPLGITRQIPEKRSRPSLDYIKNVAFPFGAKKRVAGLKLVATDMDWTHGDGPEVRGTGEALLMLLGGRRAALDDLEGDGKAVLADRF